MARGGRVIGGIFHTQRERDASRDIHRGNRPTRRDDPHPEDATDRAFTWRVTRRWWRVFPTKRHNNPNDVA